MPKGERLSHQLLHQKDRQYPHRRDLMVMDHYRYMKIIIKRGIMNKFFILPLLSISIALGATWDGAHYQATCSPQFEMAQFAMSQLPEQAYESILDIGCGSGDFTMQLAQRASYVLGVDYSESMIRRAQESYGISGSTSKPK